MNGVYWGVTRDLSLGIDIYFETFCNWRAHFSEVMQVLCFFQHLASANYYHLGKKNTHTQTQKNVLLCSSWP